MLTDYFKQLNELNENYQLKENFEIHSQLNNKIFNLDDNLMKQEIRQRLIEIADLFVSSMQENNVPIKVYDYWLVGSNAAYNYTKDSDIDIHIIVDMDIVADQYLLRLLYDYIKSSFSQKYDIMVKGHEVELYLEDIKTSAVTNGIYSLKQDKWIKFPQEQEPRIIDIEETPLFIEWLDRYEHLEDEECEQFLDDLYVMRKISLANEGEFGDGNLIFKEFRNRGYLDDLKDRKYKFESDRLTLEKLEEDVLTEATTPQYRMMLINLLYILTDNEHLKKLLKSGKPIHFHHIDNEYEQYNTKTGTAIRAKNNNINNIMIIEEAGHRRLKTKKDPNFKEENARIIEELISNNQAFNVMDCFPKAVADIISKAIEDGDIL